MRLVSLGIAAVIVDRVGIEPLYWIGGSLRALAGVLGLALLGGRRLQAGTSDGWDHRQN